MVRTESPTSMTERFFLRANRPKPRCKEANPEGGCDIGDAFRRDRKIIAAAAIINTVSMICISDEARRA